MNLPQQKFREIAFQLLYSYDLGSLDNAGLIPLIMKQLSVTRKAVKMADARVALLRAKLPEIDAIITKTSQAYAFDRIQTVERNVLRLGVFELLFDPDIPPKVAITEAVRLAHKFGSNEAAAFVNALLDGIYKQSQGTKISQTEIDKTSQELLQSEEIAREASLNHKSEEDDEFSDD